MSNMKKFFPVLLVAAILGSACTASAQLITYSGTPNLSQALTFDKFDTLGGTRTLQSIQVIFNLNSNGGTFILDNDSAQAAAGGFEFGAKGGISSTDVALLNSAFQPVTVDLDALHTGSFSLAGDLNPISGDYNPAPNDGMQYNGTAEFDADSGFIASALFAQYIGTGTFDIDIAVIQWQDFGGISGIEWAVTPVNVEGSVEVIYTYVPEPATMSLLSIGGLTLLRKRRK